MTEEGTTGEVTSEEIQEAKLMGWADKDQWRGKPEEWVDAKAFLETGRKILPLVRKSNERMGQELSQLGGKVSSLESALQAANATIRTLEAAHDADVKEQVAAARKQLREELADASREGDHEAVADLTDKLTQLRDAEDDAGKRTADEGKRKANGEDLEEGGKKLELPQEVISWFDRHSDFAKDQRKVALANVIATEMLQKGDTRKGPEFLDAVREQVEEVLGGAVSSSKVASGNGGAGRSSSGAVSGKTYADLPADAKAACDKQALRLVGPTRAHKDVESWRKSYVKQYFQEQ